LGKKRKINQVFSVTPIFMRDLDHKEDELKKAKQEE